MKIINWRRKLSAAIMTAGLMVPTAASAAGLNTNLVNDPGFENVDTAVTCCYSAVKLNSWADGAQTAFAYNFNQNYDGGGPLAGGGTYYFTANGEGSGTDIRTPGQVAQNIDLSTGPTAAAIATGQATYQLSAFFTSYAPDTDFGSMQIDFLNAGGASLGTGLVADTPGTNKVWRQLSTGGLVPIGTATARISLFGTTTGGVGGPDGYIDNVDFRIVPEPTTLFLVSISLAAGFAVPVGRNARRR
jgi:hypothetical protein